VSQGGTVLVVAYLFPPTADVGVHRTLRFVRWLPESGWRPVVLTASNARVDHVDPALCARVPAGLPVYGARSFELLNDGVSISSGRPSIAPRLARNLWRELAVPDHRVGWVPRAVRMGRRIVERHRPRAIYVSGKPFSSYWIAERLSRRFGLPWVMDMRDPWVHDGRVRPRNALHSAGARRMEAQLVERAAAVIANTHLNRRDLVERYPKLPAEKFVAIPNGYDRGDYADLPHEKLDRFTVAFTGAFRVPGRLRLPVWDTHGPDFFFRALGELFRAQPALRQDVDVVFMGGGSSAVSAAARAHGVESNVQVIPWRPYAEALAIVKQAHVALCMLPRGEHSAGMVPSKLYQYLGLGTHVLALADEGEAASVVRETRGGTVVRGDDVAGIARALDELYRRHRSGARAEPDTEVLSRYDARTLTPCLAAVLDSVTDGSAAPARAG
jgi:hypothetical protein